MMGKDKATIIIFACLIINSSIAIHLALKECPLCFVKDCRCEACEIRFNKTNMGTINGVYSNPDYYCVWTKDRTPADIAETTFHELAHYYSYRDPEHFNVEVSS